MRAAKPSEKTLFLRLLGEGKFSYLDLEEDSNLPEIEAEARRRGVRIIRSLHDFAGVPSGLAERILRLPRRPDELPKAASMPRSSRDFKRRRRSLPRPRGKGKNPPRHGRVRFPEPGPRAPASAPSSPSRARTEPRSRRGSSIPRPWPRSTATAGRQGDENQRHHRESHPPFPLAFHPQLGLRSARSRRGLRSLPHRLGEGVPGNRPAPRLGGFSVTVPFKEEVLPLCTWTEEAVRAIGACNTAVPRGRRTPGLQHRRRGLPRPPRKTLRPTGRAEKAAAGKAGFLNGVRTTVIGAGGAARSVVYALGREGAEVLVFNRTPERAERLVRDLREKPRVPGRNA